MRVPADRYSSSMEPARLALRIQELQPMENHVLQPRAAQGREPPSRVHVRIAQPILELQVMEPNALVTAANLGRGLQLMEDASHALNTQDYKIGIHALVIPVPARSFRKTGGAEHARPTQGSLLTGSLVSQIDARPEKYRQLRVPAKLVELIRQLFKEPV